MSNDVKKLFARGQFWEGIEEYCKERLQFIQKDALGSTSWDNVNRAKGQETEIAKLRTLGAEIETFTAAQR